MLARFILASLMYSPIYVISSSMLFTSAPEWIPQWAYVLLPLFPLFLFFWWIMHRDEML